MIAKPIADSAAATAKIKKTNTCPVISELKCEKTIKLVLTERSINSIDISKSRIFFLLINIPAILMQNKRALKTK